MENEKCKHCGALLSEKAKFCFECGTLISRNKQNEEKPVIASLKEEDVSDSKPDASAENELLSASKSDENITIVNEKSVDREKNDSVIQKSEEQQYNNQQSHQQDNNYNQTNQFKGSREQFNPYVTPPPSDSQYAYMSTWSYVGMMILFSLPIIGFILAIIWACDSNKINRRNYARAVLVIIAITIILSIVITVVGFVLLSDVIKELIDSFQQNGYTIPFNNYDIQIDGLIDGMKITNGAFTYRYISDIIAL
ncbi:MAG: zinc ribbon domain-containing protein [Eubacteriales bacterium]